VSKLYIVSTPIGNLGDMTYRAVEVLRTVSRILAEDTRRTRLLLERYEIRTPMVSAHEHNEAARARDVVAWLDAGQDLALVSDAGTPLVSDPGTRIVAAAREAGHQVVPVPGASAILAALTASGLPPEPFSFFGFLPRTGAGREDRLSELATLRHTAVVFEAPGRLAVLLRQLRDVAGADRAVVVAREMTKVHEEFYRGTLAEATAYYDEHEPRGEVVVVLAGAGAAESAAAEDAARSVAAQLLAQGRRPSSVARALVDRCGVPRNLAYQIALELSGGGHESA
jgi:16S rRNA (cytidine1402-2'-O)-methyltransferase